MRVLRVVVGILTLLLAIPVLIGGVAAWWTMQHRSPDGAFHADLMPIESPSRIVVVPDIDALLRRDAPIARADQTSLRLRAGGFIGMADPGDVAVFLAGVDYTELQQLNLARGPLPVQTRHVVSAGDPLENPQKQDFWVRRATSELVWTPSEDRGRQVALVIVAPPGVGPIRLHAAVTAGWLNSTTWGLLILGPVLLLMGLAALAWPQRPREIVYVMDTAAAMQAGLPAPPVNVTYQSQRLYTPPAQPTPPPAELGWPPQEPVAQTEPPREAPDDDRPMPIAGVHLHLTKRP